MSPSLEPREKSRLKMRVFSSVFWNWLFNMPWFWRPQFLREIFFFRDRVSLYSSGCPGTHSVVQAGLKLRNLPASASQVTVLNYKRNHVDYSTFGKFGLGQTKKEKKSNPQVIVVGQVFNLSTRKSRQEDPCKFEVGLVYMVSFGTDQPGPHSETLF